MDIKITELTDYNEVICSNDYIKYYYSYLNEDKIIWRLLAGHDGNIAKHLKSIHKVRIGKSNSRRFETNKEFPFGY